MGCDEWVETSVTEAGLVLTEWVEMAIDNGAMVGIDNGAMVGEAQRLFKGDAEMEATRSMVGFEGTATVGLD
jgi:hypothetical protein